MFEVRIAPAAERAITKLPRAIQTAVLETITALGSNPRPAGCRKVRGLPAHYEVYRVEVGGAHRIIYQVRETAAWILVLKVADRKDVYKRLGDLKGSLE